MIAILWTENKRLRQENQVLHREKEILIARLALEVAKRFGPSSERRPGPLDATAVEGASDTSAGTAIQEKVLAEGGQAPISSSLAVAETGVAPAQRERGGQPGHKGYGRHTPADLPREEHEHVLSESECTCPSCGLPYEETGMKDTSEEVDVQVKIVVLRHIRKWYRSTCACPAAAPLLAAPIPPKLIDCQGQIHHPDVGQILTG